jgi:hypothetical protein
LTTFLFEFVYIFKQTIYTQIVVIRGQQNYNLKIKHAIGGVEEEGMREGVNHLGPFGDVLVINDNCLWTNDFWRNKNAGLDHTEQEILENHKHWLWIK